MEKNEVTSKKLSVSIKYPNELKKCVYGETIDELIDGLELMKDGKFINNFVSRFPNLSKEQLERIDSIILTSNDAEEICNYAQRRKELSNVESFEDSLISLNNSFKIVDFAKHVMGVNVAKLEDAVIASKDADVMHYFAIIVEGANVRKLKKAIRKIKNKFYYF